MKSAQYRAGEPVCALKSMLQIGGIIFVFATVFGGYVLAGGKFDVILHALPYEGTQILGAAIGALFIAAVALVPTIFLSQILPDQSTAILSFSGTSVLIGVGVALETMKQIDSQLMMRNYEGFLS